MTQRRTPAGAGSEDEPRVDEPRVVVVGGGPVGVMTALLLARRGVPVRVYERETEIYDLPRAISMDDEIQRVFQNAGLQDALAAITTPTIGAEFVRSDGSRIVGVELPTDADWPLGHHPTVAFYQPLLERTLRDAAVDAGVDVRLGHTVVGFRQADEGVEVDVRRPDEVVETVRTGWMIGADGASSPTRKQLGIEFVDQGFDQDWLVLDVELRRDVPTLPTWVQQICDPARPITFVTGHGRYRRWEFQLLPSEDRSEMTDSARVWGLLTPWIGPEDARLIRAVVYRFHATVADRFRSGRVLLVGDAAHQMPPFLGQGLCAGLRDAANLAWKLALIDRGLATEALLETFDQERRPHAAATVAHAVGTGRLIDELAAAEADIDVSAGYGGGRRPPQLEHGLLTGEHPFVGRQMPQPRIGSTPLDDLLGPGYAVLVRADAGPEVPEEAATALAPFGSVVELPPGVLDPVIPSRGAVVVRPDRYVAAVVDDLARLGETLAIVLPVPEPE